ncbi:MAG TPA: TlpA disulfide reductase family protein [Polyangiaceae bacterium]|nr:TlpA disulfide reductase family protein [Polyangiaceae bacterium]
MGRLPSLKQGAGLLAWLGLLSAGGFAGGCDEAPRAAASAPRERSQAVVAEAEPARPAVSVPAASAPSAAVRPKAPRALCAGQSAETKTLPKKRISQARASGATTKLPEHLSANGAFTWVNFWAAWCAPCKEEIPRLLKWERDLTQRGRRFSVRFISLDDDERQLRQFLESGQTGLNATYWLKEGKERDEWMAAAGIGSDPELPIHLLIDASGHVRCRVQGAVEDADFAEVERLTAESH